MHRAWWIVGLLVIALVVGATGVAAQIAPVRIVQGSDGALYLLKGGARYSIGLDAIDDDELQAYADGGTLAGDELLAALGGTQSAQAPVPPTRDQQPAPPPVQDQQPAEAQQAAPPPAPSTAQAPCTTPTGAKSSANCVIRTTLTFTRVQGAAPGGTASVTLLATPSTSCSLSYVSPSGTTSALGAQTTDASGLATWSFGIDSSTQVGIGRVVATCGNMSINNTMQIGQPTRGR